MSLNTRAMLVSFNVSQWTGRKQDKKAADTVADSYSSNKEWGRVYKSLVADDARKKVSKVANEARTYYYERTLPWGSDGSRILPSKVYTEFATFMRKKRSEFEAVVNAFLDEYDDLIVDARVQLGSMFNINEYPTKSEIESKYDFDIVVNPIPDSGDFRITLSDNEQELIKSSIEERMNQATVNANQDLWKRLHTVVSHMSEKLSDPSAIFRDTLIENAVDLCELLPKLNITDDPNLEAMRRKVEDRLCSLQPDVLRSDMNQRQQAATHAKSILSQMKSFNSGFGWGDVAQLKEEEAA